MDAASDLNGTTPLPPGTMTVSFSVRTVLRKLKNQCSTSDAMTVWRKAMTFRQGSIERNFLLRIKTKLCKR